VKISLFLDEDSQDLNLIRALRARSVDLISCAEAGRNGYTDAEQLAWATAHSRVLFSYNTQDFMRLHKHYLTQGLSHAGLILAKQQEYSIGEEMRRLLKLLNTKSAEALRNQVEFLGRWG
jgi:hypothetical protein